MAQDPFGLIGKTIEGRFTVEHLVGEGGFGVVYRGYHLSFRQKVAVKVLKVPAHFTTAARDLFLEKFREEGEHLAKLSEHRSVVRVFDFGATPTAAGPTAPYLVLEWLEGRDLEAHMALRAKAGQGLPSEAEVIEFLRPVIDAIAFAHRLGIAHRDLKPANIFVAETALGQVPKVLDFGIAKAMQEGESATVLATHTTSGFGAFSPQYGAPEQFLRKRFGATGPWTDVYALGLVLVELLTGRRPYDGDEQPEFFMAATSDTRPTPRARRGQVSDQVEAACAKALALMPQERFQNAGELLAALPSVSLPAGVVPLALAAKPAEAGPSAQEAAFAQSAETGAFLEALSGQSGPAAEPVRPPATQAAAPARPVVSTERPAERTDRPGTVPAEPVAAAGSTDRPGTVPAEPVAAAGSTDRPGTVPAEPTTAAKPVEPAGPAPSAGAAGGRGKLVAAVGVGLGIVAVGTLVWLRNGPSATTSPDGTAVSAAPSVAGPDTSAGTSAAAAPSASAAAAPGGACPKDMVRVAKGFCIDRYEDILVDLNTGNRLSPYYNPGRNTAIAAEKAAKEYHPDAGADADAAAPLAATMAVPELPAWQRAADAVPKAVSAGNDVPNANVSGKQAEAACANANKRLCTLEEWRAACAGESGGKFPYGDAFKPGACNIFSEAHPTALLYGSAAVGHTDPRVNLVQHNGRTLLQKTGEIRSCKSVWGSDAVYDMLGNLAEWVSTPDGMACAGGYYAQSSQKGCELSTGTALGMGFANYTTGVRCCADPTP
jgi:eukaryotic-like serine/threonine-protein kinase